MTGRRERLVRDFLDAYAEEGVDGLLRYFTEDVVWEDDPDWPGAQVWHGHDGVRTVMRERLDTLRITVELESTVECGSRVLAVLRWIGVGEASGAMTALRPAVLFDFDDELVSRLRFFLDPERGRQMLEAG